MIILGLETSCDETAIGIVDAERRILANLVVSQLAEHQPYGGVVPEIAARAHLDHIDSLVREGLKTAGLRLDQLAGIAATCGPGLIGGVMVGAMTGKALAAVTQRPFLAVNHLEAHALTARLTHDVAFPYLLLLVSGGHCQLLAVKGVGDYQRLGGTIDDAVGECFDKAAKLMGLGYPGGPQVEQMARNGNPQRFALPQPMVGRAGCDFSFSGLKTAVRQIVQKDSGFRIQDSGDHLSMPNPQSQILIADLCASLQFTIAEILAERTQQALRMLDFPVTTLVVAGGVAANQCIGNRLRAVAEKAGIAFAAPPPALCTDNGVMVAWAGLERLRLGMTDALDFAARPRWPLEEQATEGDKEK